ncbi:LytTR family transcriptional regulator DNA-binding domain-containing protein [Tepidibacillus infernus]|uniref:Two-component system response regulator n=1 Tax=Tepidibacillus decaturensis TaxID=1413211 RepID=A0A135L4M3_9BACI|nr:LytTR family transcriptional regulator DNA-binding domain-containing protein [Tepidibacillus decaturensis]KXG43879.1 hypothetical protein U473_07570 [Tepidibacillus decaturensis]
MTIKVLIVDDESLARDELRYLLSQEDEIEVVGEAENGEEALTKIFNLNPDIVFLDIQMPKVDGLTVARTLLDLKKKPFIIFATAYDQHAIHAFEVNAIDYLLKPFDEDRVMKTIEKIKEKLNHPNQEVFFKWLEQLREGSNQQSKHTSKLAVQLEERVLLIDPNDIVYAFREGRGVLIKTFAETYTTKYTLQVLEEKLKNFSFFRVHRSYLVNLNHIQEMTPWFNGAYTLTMKDQQQSKVPVSRQFVKPLRDALEL